MAWVGTVMGWVGSAINWVLPTYTQAGGFSWGLGNTLMNWGEEIWGEVAEQVDFLKEIDSLEDITLMTNNLMPYYKIYESHKRLEELRNFSIEIPALDDFEKQRDEMMDILATDPDQLTSVYDESTLRKYGIDPDTTDAETMIAKRGARARYMEQQDDLSRQFARSGVEGNTAMAAAQAQLGLSSAAMDAQMGMEAERQFTESISGLQDRYERVSTGVMNMQNQLAQFEFTKMLSVQQAEKSLTEGVAGVIQNMADNIELEKMASSQAAEDIEAELNAGEAGDGVGAVPVGATNMEPIGMDGRRPNQLSGYPSQQDGLGAPAYGRNEASHLQSQDWFRQQANSMAHASMNPNAAPYGPQYQPGWAPPTGNPGYLGWYSQPQKSPVPTVTNQGMTWPSTGGEFTPGPFQTTQGPHPEVNMWDWIGGNRQFAGEWKP